MIFRSCFAITGNLRFLSHLDLLKLMERALRRARIPIAFSHGFNPHPKMAFATAKAVGLAGLSEYFDVELDQEMAPLEFQRRLQENCPAGIEIKEVKEISPGEPSLMSVVNCASYRVKVRVKNKLDAKELEQKIDRIFSRKEIIVQRISPKRKREYDIRPGIFSLTYHFCTPQEVLLEMDLKIGSEGSVKPGEVVEALSLEDCQILDLTRTGLFVLKKSGEKVLPI